jgi:hypothetical protein
VKRCVILAKTNPDAAKSFYANVWHFAPVTACTKLIGYLHKAVTRSMSLDPAAAPEEGKYRPFSRKLTGADMVQAVFL